LTGRGFYFRVDGWRSWSFAIASGVAGRQGATEQASTTRMLIATCSPRKGPASLAAGSGLGFSAPTTMASRHRMWRAAPAHAQEPIRTAKLRTCSLRCDCRLVASKPVDKAAVLRAPSHVAGIPSVAHPKPDISAAKHVHPVCGRSGTASLKQRSDCSSEWVTTNSLQPTGVGKRFVVLLAFHRRPRLPMTCLLLRTRRRSRDWVSRRFHPGLC